MYICIILYHIISIHFVWETHIQHHLSQLLHIHLLTIDRLLRDNPLVTIVLEHCFHSTIPLTLTWNHPVNPRNSLDSSSENQSLWGVTT